MPSPSGSMSPASTGFNEARARSPGRSPPTLRSLPRPIGFNEARARSPGRLGGMLDGLRDEIRFNEARARSPGRLPGRRPPASTSPSCFNEARARSPGRYAAVQLAGPVGCVASMRPGRDRPGDDQVGRRGDWCAGASMRPGRDRPGDGAEVAQARIVPCPASMRPGRDRPGDEHGGARGSGSGPGFNEARARSPGRYAGRSFPSAGGPWLQ